MQGRQRPRHHPFAARLFDGSRRTIRNDYLEPFLARGNGSRQPGRPRANDEHVGIFPWTDPSPTFLLYPNKIRFALSRNQDATMETADTSLVGMSKGCIPH